MIMIRKETLKVGDKVCYQPFSYEEREWQNGVVYRKFQWQGKNCIVIESKGSNAVVMYQNEKGNYVQFLLPTENIYELTEGE